LILSAFYDFPLKFISEASRTVRNGFYRSGFVKIGARRRNINSSQKTTYPVCFSIFEVRYAIPLSGSQAVNVNFFTDPRSTC
jgi:hypothetical protein